VILVSADFTSYDVWTFCTEVNVYFLVILLLVIFLSLEFFMGPVYFAYFYVTIPIIFVRQDYYASILGRLKLIKYIFIYVLQY